ncbi:hypothetical protein M011DRAFT_213255 [Sporormia fimetaria CBS 119925]|uniref:Uncharacterized protein n=1 Tax=Sporormia fimetaria CBS 119925 TaxID=1340428 RepID=A0A6A6V2H5_9PLEO|nr:hypothetical protein M011DRAFT_213255 [Sporormia fimetaria CBS 119925]
MGLDSRRPPLPAPTETETDDTLRDDLATNLSTRTDKTSYSIPEDGTPVTINTARGGLHKKHPSQTSLLIEYFEGAKTEGKSRSRPSVRVRVTPSSRKSKSSANDHLKITQTSRHANKPSYTRRISLGKGRENAAQPTEVSVSDESNLSSLPPVEIEVLNGSDLSSHGGRYIPPTSDISSMPPDSMLNTYPVILPPPRRRSRSLDREEVTQSMAQDSLKAPTRQRSRSLSKERITQRVMEKLQQKPTEGGSAKEAKLGRDELTASRQSRRRSSRSSREEELSGVSGAESSLLSSNVNTKRRSGDTHSVRSGLSGTSSINNPKLLATVEDAIKRLILPEINALKEQQRTQVNREKFERQSRDSAATVDSTSSREHSRRRVSKSSSTPHLHAGQPKIILSKDSSHLKENLDSRSSSRKERRSSRGSERSHTTSTSRGDEKLRRQKSKDKNSVSARDAALLSLGAAGLTAAALKHHESHESKDERRRHRRSRGSRGTSISESVDEERYREDREEIPPLPLLQSELIGGSEITRDSILSAESEPRDRPDSRSSRGTFPETPVQEVVRNLVSPGQRTPTRTPVALQRSLGTAHSNRSLGELSLNSPKSDRSASGKKGVSAAALEAAAAAKARAIESSQPQASQYEIAEQTPPRGLSPIQSEASYQEEAHLTGSPGPLRSIHSKGTVSSADRHVRESASNLSIQSFDSSPSTKARTRKRPQGVTLERTREILGQSPTPTPRDVDDFFEKNHEQNELYRRELERSQQSSPQDQQHISTYTNYTEEQSPLESPIALAQDIRKVGSNPEYVDPSIAVESAVASLHEPSNVSVPSSVSSPLKKSRLSQVSPVQEQDFAQREPPNQDHLSQGRWAAIRGHAQTLADQSQPANSPRQSLSHSIIEQPQMHHSAFPVQGEDMPEIGYGVDDASDVTTNPSIIQGPLGGGDYHAHAEALLRGHQSQEHTTSHHSYGEAAALGAGAAAALAAASSTRLGEEKTPLIQHEQYQPSVEDDYDQVYEAEQQYTSNPAFARAASTPSRSPGMLKDEGYQSAHQPGGVTPDLYRSKYLDDDGLGDFDDDHFDTTGVFTGGNHARHVSGNSHGVDSPLYDSATGRGIDRIQSKDVVALMDHLTVRDAQRNARDTEILVTLVRSAAEMRNSLEEMKQFIRTQDAMIMNTTDKRIDIAEQRILQGPRPQPLGSPRVPRSSTDEINEVEQKRKNVFRRALKGLSLKGDGDIKKIEGMLMQLLSEVEGLKDAQIRGLAQQNTAQSLNSYENLRASGDPGYEPEGRAGTASSPNQSGYLSNPSSRRIQDMHSGFDVHQPHRVSTVDEEDEEYEQEREYENTERMTTPTQEARRNVSGSSQVTPPERKNFRQSQSQENTPKRKHKSNTSSLFGIPKISRWSRTTASTNRDSESLPRNSGSNDKRYSTGSGSNIQVAYYGDEPYAGPEDDRFRSDPSLVREEQRSIRSASPLIPDDEPHYVLDDPKYQAHRNSLNLQHPQPRPGPTGRHTNHLDSQAKIFDPVRSPDFDQWGSNPSLARNRLSSGGAGYAPGHLSPISSDGGYSQHSAAEQAAAPPPRPPKIRDDGPLIPPQPQQQPLAGHGQTRTMYSAMNEFGNSPGALTPLAPIQEVRYSLETDRGHRYSDDLSSRPSAQNLNQGYVTASPQRKITGPRPMGSRSPAPPQQQQQIRRKPVNGT